MQTSQMRRRSTGNRIDLPVALVPACAEFAMPVPSSLPTSSAATFVFGGGDGFCRPVTLAPTLAELAFALIVRRQRT